MGWAIGFDGRWNRDVGYGVPAWCDHPGCCEYIDRGLSFVCGGEPYGGDRGCGLYFCSAHLWLVDDPDSDGMFQVCERCVEVDEDGSVTGRAFEPKPEHPTWAAWKLFDDSWQTWRDEHPHEVEVLHALCT